MTLSQEVPPSTDGAPRPPSPPKGGLQVGQIVAGLVLVLLGVAWFLDRFDVVDLSPAVILPAILVLVGGAIVVGSTRRAQPGLIVLGAFVLAATVIASIVPAGVAGDGLGQRTHRVQAVSELAPSYGVGMGELVLDLRDLEPGVEAETSLEVGLGSLIVYVPDDTPLQIEAQTGAGEVDILGRSTDGFGVEQSYRSPDFTGDGLRIRAEVGMGSIEVRR